MASTPRQLLVSVAAAAAGAAPGVARALSVNPASVTEASQRRIGEPGITIFDRLLHGWSITRTKGAS